MNVEPLMKWLPRAIVIAAFGFYVYSTLAVIGVLAYSKSPEGPVLAAVAILLLWGGPFYAVYRVDGVRDWILGRRGL
jgi:hypothetical protein